MVSSLCADCASCFGLCCVAPAFAASADFAIDKPAGTPCGNLLADFCCGIHENLRPQGFAGCTVFDCLGAGQKVAAVTYHGRDWRDFPATAREMFDVFAVMRQLHELLWYLREAVERAPSVSEAAQVLDEVERTTMTSPAELLAVDVDALRARVGPLLALASELVRGGVRGPRNHRGADLVGRRLRGADLRGADLRSAYLIGANLADADLRLADLLGADLRGADVRGATLSDALFLTQFQLNGANGDRNTTFPKALSRPTHW